MATGVIIDDESSGREILHELIKEYVPQITIVGMADSVQTGIEIIQLEEPDIVFLDIEMPRGTGFDILSQLEKRNFQVIFVTAYDQYAMRAIKFSALDYLLKPINITDLQMAVKKAIRQSEEDSSDQRINFLLEEIHAKQKNNERITLPTIDGFDIVSINDIVYCQSDRNYTQFFFSDQKKVLVTKTLKEYEKQLAALDFFRIHQSYLVNLNHIRKYIKGRGGYVVMSNGDELEVSRRQKPEFVKAFMVE